MTSKAGTNCLNAKNTTNVGKKKKAQTFLVVVAQAHPHVPWNHRDHCGVNNMDFYIASTMIILPIFLTSAQIQSYI